MRSYKTSAICYTGPGDNESRRFLMGMVEAGELVLAVLTPRYLATWGLSTWLKL